MGKSLELAAIPTFERKYENKEGNNLIVNYPGIGFVRVCAGWNARQQDANEQYGNPRQHDGG